MTRTSLPRLDNRQARHLFLDKHGLAETPKGSGKGEDLLNVIRQIGFVQVDSINTVARAHHMILFARRPAYKETALKNLLEKDRALFEHWTHDASIIPTEFYPQWHLHFKRHRERLAERWQKWRRDGFLDKIDGVLKQITETGTCTSGDVGENEQRKSGGWWDWHPSKTSLEYLWRTGELAVCHRTNFQKAYDLSERVIPQDIRSNVPHEAETIEWAATNALARLGFATSGEIAAFWDLITPAEAKDWCQKALADGRIIEADIEMVPGQKPRQSFLFPETLDQLADLPEPTSRVRILSPFDPAVRDRKRAERLFGFHYRIEVFVPEPKRQYGYYVFPVLEGDRLIGRIDMKALRAEDRLHVRAFWPEPGLRASKARLKKLEAELDRMARFAGCSTTTFENDWQRSA